MKNKTNNNNKKIKSQTPSATEETVCSLQGNKVIDGHEQHLDLLVVGIGSQVRVQVALEALQHWPHVLAGHWVGRIQIHNSLFKVPGL